MTALDHFDKAFAECPLIAILRGLHPDEAVSIGEALSKQELRFSKCR